MRPFIVLAVSLCVVAAPCAFAFAETPGDLRRIVGKWEGAYYAFPHAIRMTVELRSGNARGATVVGVVEYGPLVEQRGVPAVEPGRYEVSGVYTPRADTLYLRPGRWIKQPRQRMMLHEMVGVLDPRNARIGGRFLVRGASVPHFVLARPNQAQPLLDAMKAGFTRGWAQRVDKQKFTNRQLIAWASRVEKEYPANRPSRQQVTSLIVKSYGLFEDNCFKKHFGKTFDQLTTGERSAINRRFAQPSDREIAEYSWLSRPFNGPISHGTPEITGALLAQRVIRNWRNDGLARMRAMPVEFDAFDRIDAFSDAAKLQLALLWPSERNEVIDTCNATRRRIADPLMVKRADDAIATPDGYNGAVALANWRTANARLMTWASDQTRSGSIKRINDKLDELLEPLLAAEVANLEPVEHGVPGLRKTSDWYRAFRYRYRFASGRPAYRRAIDRLRDARADQLLAVSNSAIELINRMGVEQEIDRFIAFLMPIPSDIHSKGGRNINTAARARIGHILAEKERKAAAQFMAFAAVLADLAKRNAEAENDRVGAAMFVVGRDFLIKEALHKIDPNLSDEQIDQVQIYISLWADGKLNQKSVNREESFADFTRGLRKRFPDHPWSDQAAKAFWELGKRWKR